MIIVALYNIKLKKKSNIEDSVSKKDKSDKTELKIAEKKKTVELKNKKKLNSLSCVLPILIILLIASISFNVMFLVNHFKVKDEIDELIDEKDSIESDLFDILGNKSKNYMKSKINFFDDTVVFVIEGYGNYYSNYDCMLQRTGNSEYSYWAYNIEAAKSKGYKEYKCSNLTYKNGYLELE